MPLRSNDRTLVERYTRILLLAENIVTVEVSTAIATEAAALRATHKFRTPDAIQLATAIQEGADAFFTNDATFLKTLPLEILFVDRLVGLN